MFYSSLLDHYMNMVMVTPPPPPSLLVLMRNRFHLRINSVVELILGRGEEGLEIKMNILCLGHFRFYSILISYSIPGIDFFLP
jgi:hypothetical protein